MDKNSNIRALVFSLMFLDIAQPNNEAGLSRILWEHANLVAASTSDSWKQKDLNLARQPIEYVSLKSSKLNVDRCT